LKNPKPDKAARLEIITKVALGEKEVQVRGRFCAVTRLARVNGTTNPASDLVSEPQAERPTTLTASRALIFGVAHVFILQHVRPAN